MIVVLLVLVVVLLLVVLLVLLVVVVVVASYQGLLMIHDLALKDHGLHPNGAGSGLLKLGFRVRLPPKRPEMQSRCPWHSEVHVLVKLDRCHQFNRHSESTTLCCLVGCHTVYLAIWGFSIVTNCTITQ